MATDTQVNNLVINVLSKAQYDNISNKSNTELYLVPDEIDSTPTANSTNTVTSGGVKSALDAKQDSLVSGTNIKTINNESLLGSGNITITGSGSGSGEENVIEAITFNGTPATITNKTAAITATIPVDSNLVHKSGNETISGTKEFNDLINVYDEFHFGSANAVFQADAVVGFDWIQDIDNYSVQDALDEKYKKPSGGIPVTDLASAVQTSLGKADTALQSYTETDPTVPAWAKASSKPTYTASEVGALPDTTVIPAAPGTLITNATTAQTASSGQAMSGNITLHKVAKTGTYSDLIGTPTIPTVNNATLTIQKNGTTVNTFTANASSNVTANIQVNEVPSYSSSNNGQILSVVNGSLTWITPAQIYSGSATPSNSTGNNGDIYVQS